MQITSAPAQSAPSATEIPYQWTHGNLAALQKDNVQLGLHDTTARGAGPLETNSGWLNTDRPNIVAAAGFEDAVRMAQQRAEASGTVVRQAQGVLEADNGQFFVAALGQGNHTFFPRHFYESPLGFDGFGDVIPGVDGWEITGSRVNDDLRAIVGSNHWMDLRAASHALATDLPAWAAPKHG